jgi:hypothetical protein
MRLGWGPFSIDSLEKAGKMYGVLCEIVWNQYEIVYKEKWVTEDSDMEEYE